MNQILVFSCLYRSAELASRIDAALDEKKNPIIILKRVNMSRCMLNSLIFAEYEKGHTFSIYILRYFQVEFYKFYTNIPRLLLDHFQCIMGLVVYSHVL